jgi:hypothetical protein
VYKLYREYGLAWQGRGGNGRKKNAIALKLYRNNLLGIELGGRGFNINNTAVAGAECNTVIELNLEHHAA